MNQSARASGPKEFLAITKSLGIPRQIKVKHNVFRSLVRRRVGWITEAVKINAVYNTSGRLKEGVHEGLEGVLLSIHNLEGRQLVCSIVFAVHSDQ